MGENTQQTVWNFDGAELFEIFEIKKDFIYYLDNWDLENAYWKLRSMRRELDAVLKRKQKRFDGIHLTEEEKKKSKEKKKKKSEKETVDGDLKDLSDIRNKYVKENNHSDEDKTKFYTALENFYLNLCYIMKSHGLYFREGEDATFAVLRR